MNNDFATNLSAARARVTAARKATIDAAIALHDAYWAYDRAAPGADKVAARKAFYTANEALECATKARQEAKIALDACTRART